MAALSCSRNPARAEPISGPWDPLLPMVLSAGAPGDPAGDCQCTSLCRPPPRRRRRRWIWTQIPRQSGHHQPDSQPRFTLSANRVNGKQAIEYVIRRAGSQMGVPVPWGGGSPDPAQAWASTPGADTVGFDCSGLTRYAFAGVGVYRPFPPGIMRRGPQSPAVRGQARRPVVLGAPAGSTRSLYLGGGGQMPRSAATGVPVKISPRGTSRA